MRLVRIAYLTVIAACYACQGIAVSAGESALDALRGEVDEPSSGDSEKDRHDKLRSGRNGRSRDDCQDGHRRSPWSFNIGSSSSSSSSSSEDETISGEQAVGWAILFGVTSPWWVPMTVLESEEEAFQGFPTAPYANGSDGYLVFDSVETDDLASDTRAWGGRLSLDAGTNFDGVTTQTGRLRLDTDSRFGLDTEWANLFERNAGSSDWLGRGDCNLVVRFAQSPRVQFHSGIGINWLADRNNADVGFNFTYGVDLFPVDPVVTSATIDLGKIGDASLIHFRGTVGAMISPRLHLYTGYDLLDLEGASIHSFLTGIEFWF